MTLALQRYLVATSYEGITFPAVDLQTAWGHDSKRHQGYLTPGADVQTTGRKPLAIHMRIALVNNIRGWPNNLFPDRYGQLIAKFRGTPKGTLIHPLYGPITVHTDDVVEHVDGKISNGLFLDVSWTESANPDQIFQGQTSGAGTINVSPADATQNSAIAADALTPALPASDLPKPALLSPVMSTMLNILQAGTLTILAANAAFNTAIKIVNGNINLAAEFGIDWHDYRAAAESCRSQCYEYRAVYLSAHPTRIYQVPVTMSLAQIAAIVYGDATQTFLLRLQNAIPDETAVARGTLITVPEALS